MDVHYYDSMLELRPESQIVEMIDEDENTKENAQETVKNDQNNAKRNLECSEINNNCDDSLNETFLEETPMSTPAPTPTSKTPRTSIVDGKEAGRRRLQSIIEDLAELQSAMREPVQKTHGVFQKVHGWFNCLWHSAKEQEPSGTIRFDDVQQLKWLGSGAHGVVFLGIYKGQEIAVKKYRELEITLKELETLKQLKHENIVEFKGFCTKAPVYAIMMEYCPRSLKDVLSKCHVPPYLVLDWSAQIARGMDYLHKQDIVHRDLKSANVLVAQDEKTIKITDFGCSTMCKGVSTDMSFSGTVNYMAPELIRSEKCTKQVDIWSFGVVLWELLTGEIPYDGVATTAIILGVGSDSLHLPIPTSTPEGFQCILKLCWQKNPKHRLEFNQIITHLDILNSDTDFVDTPEEEYISMQLLWRKEIHNMFEQMNQKEDEIKRKEEELIHRRQEELRHAQDIKMLYEQKLKDLVSLCDRVEKLEIELLHERDQLARRRKNRSKQKKKRHQKTVAEYSDTEDPRNIRLSADSLALMEDKRTAEAEREELSHQLEKVTAEVSADVKRQLSFAQELDGQLQLQADI